MKQKLINFYCDDNGATAIEYSIMAAGIGMAIFGVMSALGVDISSAFTAVDSAIQ